jgi:aminoglycoside phosphotransferase (APT) family kinase protein
MPDSAADQSVSTALIEFLRGYASAPTMAFAEEPARISGGFDTTIYSFRLSEGPADLSRPLILRVYRDGGIQQARFEAAVQREVAEQGYPAPQVIVLCEDAAILGGAFMVMERRAGEPMLDRMLGRSMARMPVLLAQTQARLHALDPAPVQRALQDAGIAHRKGMTFEGAWEAMIEHARLEGLREGFAWITANRPISTATVLCHGDLHPLNVMLEGDQVSGVLDWANARIDQPAWDVGASIALLGHGPVDLPGPLLPIADLARRWMVGRFVRAYTKQRPIDIDAVRYFEATRLMGFMVEVGIVRQARAGVIAPVTKPTAFEHPRVLRGIFRRFLAITGVDVSLPAPE